MEYLANTGFDTLAMDTTGYGRSTRPAAMNDPCNLSAAQQLALAGDGDAEACAPSYAQQMTTIASDWNDIGAVVDYVRSLRHVSQVSLVSWSLGGRAPPASRRKIPIRCNGWCCWRRLTAAKRRQTRLPKSRRRVRR